MNWRANFEVQSNARESESLVKVQFAIDSCRLVSQSNYLNNSTTIVIGLF